MTKKMIEVVVEPNFANYLEGSVDSLIQYLTELNQTEFQDLTIIEEYGYDTSASYYRIVGKRLENDKEYSYRLQVEERILARTAKQKAKTEEKERKELARLKKKYEE